MQPSRGASTFYFWVWLTWISREMEAWSAEAKSALALSREAMAEFMAGPEVDLGAAQLDLGAGEVRGGAVPVQLGQLEVPLGGESTLILDERFDPMELLRGRRSAHAGDVEACTGGLDPQRHRPFKLGDLPVQGFEPFLCGIPALTGQLELLL